MLFPISRRSYVPYLLAFLIFASAAAVRLAIPGGLGTRVPYLTFFPAVMLAVLAGGLPAGSLVIILSALFTCYFSFEPIGHLAVRSKEDLIGLAVFLASCTMVCALSAITRRAQKRASEAEARVRLAWERELSSGALHRSEAKFRDQLSSVAATVPGVINSFRLRPDGSSCLPFASSALDQIYGLQPCEVAEDASALFNLIHPDDRGQVEAGMVESARTLGHWQVEFRVNHPTRGEIWVEGHSVPQREPDGGTLWHGFLHDVTERRLSQEALRDSSEFCRQIISGAEEGVVVYGTDLRYQVWNPFMEQFTGCCAREVLGGQPLELFPFLEAAGVLDSLKKALLGENSRILEFTYFSPYKQRICWVSHTFTALRNARGDIIGVIGIVRDITDLKEVEEELRGSEARFRILVEQAADAFFVHGRDGRFLDVNRHACESLGYRREELLQMGIPDIDPYIDLERAQQGWDLLAPGETCTIQGYQRRKDGSHFPAEVRLGSYQQNGERIYIGLVRDISERSQSEELVREASRRLELATRSGKLGVWDLDVTTGALHWNDRMFELYGIDPKNFDGTRGSWIDRLHPGDRDRVLAAGDAALDGTREFDFEFRVVTPQGKVRSLKADAVVVRDPQGRALRMIGLNRDITEQRSLEAQLHQAQKMEAVGRLAGGVAHDFNNNLTVILGYAELSMMVAINSEAFHDYLAEIIKAAEHSRDITQQLLAFSRNEIIAPRQVDLNQLIRQTDKTLVRLIGEDVRLGLNTAEGLWPILIDPAQVNQIIMNLAVNARDAMPLGGTLSIETRNLVIDEMYCLSNPEARQGEYVQLTVSDTGVGMDREMQSHIFEPFFTTKGIGKGTGLGLATVYGIMRQNDGFIKVYSEPGQGAAFALFFPRLTQERDAEVVAARTVAAGEGVVLLVEDEATVRQMAQLMLEHAGYSVLVAPTPFEALEICRRPGLRIDCLLTDVIMPGMNGVDLSAAVRELRPGIGMVYMSGYTADMIAHHGVLARGVIFVQKPFDMNSLNDKVQEAMKSCQKN
jgi:two-component system, cell cycle sensor histidine kinase and response regulator CckA